MPEQFDFSGRAVLITGAASGIGAATGQFLADEGAERLVLVDLKSDRLGSEQLSCAVQVFGGDVGDPAFWEKIAGDLPPLDHAVINAGISSSSRIVETPFEEWRRIMSTNLDGAFLSLRTALRNIRDGGSIVLTASVNGLRAQPGTGAYGASKAGIMQLARVAAKEAAPRGIRVNAIAPGGVDTPIWDEVPFFQEIASQHGGDRSAALRAMAAMATPLGRFATSQEIARQIAFLLSDLSATITGATLVSDGGYSI
jgi:NAD(P)-dependent dehydrogenase (short-subunit alcohol dehydrogenase family)